MLQRMCCLAVLLQACAAGKGDGSGDFSGGGGAGGDGGGGGDRPDLWASVARCTLSPAPSADIQRVRVDAGGTLWVLDQGGVLARYEPAPGEDCVLEGEAVLGTPGELDTITDFDLDGEGRVLALEFFDLLHRLDASGGVELTCDVEAGHTVVPDEDGERAWIVSVGDDSLAHAELGSDACAMVEGEVVLERPVSALGAWTPGGLAMSAFDTTGSWPPGVLLDPDTGAILGEFGGGADPLAGDAPASFVDLVPVDGGMLAAGHPDGDLWALGADGGIEGRRVTTEGLVAPEDPDARIGLQSIAWSATGPSYLAAGWLDVQGLWRMDL